MKSRTARFLYAVLLLIAFALPGLACGPTPQNSGTTSTMSPGRERWTRKRMGELKRRRQHYNQPHTTDAVDVYSKYQQFNDPFAVTEADRRREALRRQHEIDTIEFLALKKERGELSPAGQQKLNELLRHYRSEGH